MKVNTTRFGSLEIDDSSVVRMTRGLLGFEDHKSFCLIQHRPDSNFRWLQSTDEPDLAFVVIDPSNFVENYEIEISDTDAESLHLSAAEDALVLAVVTVSNEARDVTANLAAPVVINSKELTGMQIVLQGDAYTVKHQLVTEQANDSREATTLKAA